MGHLIVRQSTIKTEERFMTLVGRKLVTVKNPRGGQVAVMIKNDAGFTAVAVGDTAKEAEAAAVKKANQLQAAA